MVTEHLGKGGNLEKENEKKTERKKKIPSLQWEVVIHTKINRANAEGEEGACKLS